MDGNQQPNAFDINSSIQRCLVKAIALHGLGLYIYAGEDLPVTSVESTAANDEPTEPTKLAVPRAETKRTGPTISVFKQNHIQQLIVETGTDLNRFLDYFGLRAIKDLAEADFVRVIRSLEHRRAA